MYHFPAWSNRNHGHTGFGADFEQQPEFVTGNVGPLLDGGILLQQRILFPPQQLLAHTHTLGVLGRVLSIAQFKPFITTVSHCAADRAMDRCEAQGL